MASTKADAGVKIAFAAAAVLTLVGIIADEAIVGWITGLSVLGCLLYTMIKLPLRTSLLWIMFFALTLENPSELPASGYWESPFYPVGVLVLNHLNGATGMSILHFSGMDVFLGSLLLIAFYRRATGSKIDRAGQFPSPEPLVKLAFVSLGGTVFVWLSGLLRGGDNQFAVWQVNAVMYVPIVFLIFHLALRGPKDCLPLAKTLIAAAVLRSCVAVYVMNTIVLPPDPDGNTSIPYATSHHDSILFAAAFVLLVVLMIHRVKGAKRWALFILPILVAGMMNNHRRMVYVQVGMIFASLYFITPMNATKRKIRKFVWILAPFLALYVAIGWGHPTGPFKPVATIRSVVDPSTNISALEREIENYDLLCTVREHPMLGVGYGNRYLEIIGLLPMGYELEPYLPHNSLLGLWAYAGYLGYTAMTLLWYGGVYFAMRAYRYCTSSEERTAAFMSVAMVLMYSVQCWGDLGLGSWTGVFTAAPAIALAGKLATAAGAWEAKGRKKQPSRSAAPEPAPVAGATAPRWGMP